MLLDLSGMNMSDLGIGEGKRTRLARRQVLLKAHDDGWECAADLEDLGHEFPAGGVIALGDDESVDFYKGWNVHVLEGRLGRRRRRGRPRGDPLVVKLGRLDGALALAPD